MKTTGMISAHQSQWATAECNKFEQDTGMTVIHLGVSGSVLHGTSDASSDVDLQGYFLPAIRDLVIGANVTPTHFEDEHLSIEMTLRPITDLYSLIGKADTNTLDALFAPESTYVYTTDEFQQFVTNADCFVSTELTGVLSYIRTHTETYGNKIRRVNIVKQALAALEDFEGEYVGDLPAEFFTIDEVTFEDKGKHSLIHVLDKSFNLKTKISDMVTSLSKKLQQYGRRTAVTVENGYDNKSLSHIVRIAYMAEDILTTGAVQLPLEKSKAEHCYRIKRSVMDESTLAETMHWLETKAEYISNLAMLNERCLRPTPNTDLAMVIIEQLIGYHG